MQLKMLQMGIPRTIAKREMLQRNSQGKMTEDRLYSLIYNIYEDDDKAAKSVSDFIIQKAKRQS